MATDAYSPFPRFSFEEYLARNARSNEKLEYLLGFVYARAEGTLQHSWISGRLITALNIRLTGRPCFVLTSDAMVETP